MAACASSAGALFCRTCSRFSLFGTSRNSLYKVAVVSIAQQQKRGLHQDLFFGNIKCFQRSRLTRSAPLRYASSMVKQQTPDDVQSTEVDQPRTSDETMIGKVKKAVINDQMFRRIFSVVHFGGRQYKIATNDIIMVHKIAAKCGDKIRFQKVLMVGGRDFSLIGKPLLSLDQVYVEATVLEKTRGRKVIVFKKKRRKNYKRWRGHRQDLTVLRINKIRLNADFIDVSSRDQA